MSEKDSTVNLTDVQAEQTQLNENVSTSENTQSDEAVAKVDTDIAVEAQTENAVEANSEISEQSEQSENSENPENAVEENSENPENAVEENSEKTDELTEAEESEQPKWLRITKRVLSIALYSILGILVVIVIWLCIDKFILGSPAPSLFGRSAFVVSTGSMSGTIEVGDIVITKKTNDYKIGDIVTFLRHKEDGTTEIWTHRIIRADNGTYLTKGDANLTDDGQTITKDDIIGEVETDENGQPVSVIRGVGLFFFWLKEDMGWVYLVALILIVAFGIYFYRRLGNSEADKE